LNKIKKGDDVIVLTGKDKGRQGQVIKVIKNKKILVENLNIVKKHQKGNANPYIKCNVDEPNNQKR